MRLLVFSLLLLSISVFAQEKEAKKGPPPAPKNLKLLEAGPNLIPTMRAFEAALGVDKCTFCHVMGDFASDDNPMKVTARMMIGMAREINSKFPDGKRHVSCYTCHRGAEIPEMEAPAAK